MTRGTLCSWHPGNVGSVALVAALTLYLFHVSAKEDWLNRRRDDFGAYLGQQV
jgi:hypothetical protein